MRELRIGRQGGSAWLLAALVAGAGLFANAAWGQPVGPAWGGPYEIYQVRDGDTVQNIAARFGVSADLIANLNGLSEWVIRPRQDLAIPLPGAPANDKAAARDTTRKLPPRFAVVAASGPITARPEGGKPLWEPAVGTRLVVKAEQESHWGVVMVDGSIGWIGKSCLRVTEEEIAPEQLENMLKQAQGGRPDVAAAASAYMGVPYRYGGNSLYGLDCSALVQAACSACGLRMPRTAAAQYEVGRPVGINELLPGDRLYFVDRSGHINHTGIYLGDWRFLHASSRRGAVGIDLLTDSFYWSRFVGARRF